MSVQQYDSVCKDRFDSIETKITESNNAVISKIDCLDKKLFHDNGAECLQSKINRHELDIKAQEKYWKWVFGVITVVMIGLISKGIYALVTFFAAHPNGK